MTGQKKGHSYPLKKLNYAFGGWKREVKNSLPTLFL